MLDFPKHPAASNPFNGFLASCERRMSVGRAQDVVSGSDLRVVQGYTENQEEMNFAFDFVGRVQRIAFAYDRLCELTVEHYTRRDKWEPAFKEKGAYTPSPEETEAEARWNLETDLLTFYIYYESSCCLSFLFPEMQS